MFYKCHSHFMVLLFGPAVGHGMPFDLAGFEDHSRKGLERSTTVQPSFAVSAKALRNWSFDGMTQSIICHDQLDVVGLEVVAFHERPGITQGHANNSDLVMSESMAGLPWPLPARNRSEIDDMGNNRDP
jgi:hypothetical protein